MGHNDQDAGFDGQILAIAKHFFNRTPRLKKCRSGANYCTILYFDGKIADRVLKITRHNRWAIEAERCLFPAMREQRLPVPEIEFSHKDYPEPCEPFIIMPKFSDLTLDNLCEKNTEASWFACRQSGQFIHLLHEKFAGTFQSFLSFEDTRGQLNAIQQFIDKALDLIPIQEHHPELLSIIEHHFASFNRPTARRLIHGALHGDNVVARENGEICVIDLGETIGFDSPLRDLFGLLTCWNIGIGHLEQRSALIEGYGGLKSADVRELRYWEFYHYVRGLRNHLTISVDPSYIQRLIDGIRRNAEGENVLMTRVLQLPQLSHVLKDANTCAPGFSEP